MSMYHAKETNMIKCQSDTLMLQYSKCVYDHFVFLSTSYQFQEIISIQSCIIQFLKIDNVIQGRLVSRNNVKHASRLHFSSLANVIQNEHCIRYFT